MFYKRTIFENYFSEVFFKTITKYILIILLQQST